MNKPNSIKLCPKCNSDTIKDYYRSEWICTNSKCNECVLTEKDFE